MRDHLIAPVIPDSRGAPRSCPNMWLLAGEDLSHHVPCVLVYWLVVMAARRAARAGGSQDRLVPGGALQHVTAVARAALCGEEGRLPMAGADTRWCSERGWRTAVRPGTSSGPRTRRRAAGLGGVARRVGERLRREVHGISGGRGPYRRAWPAPQLRWSARAFGGRYRSAGGRAATWRGGRSAGRLASDHGGRAGKHDRANAVAID